MNFYDFYEIFSQIIDKETKTGEDLYIIIFYKHIYCMSSLKA